MSHRYGYSLNGSHTIKETISKHKKGFETSGVATWRLSHAVTSMILTLSMIIPWWLGWQIKILFKSSKINKPQKT